MKPGPVTNYDKNNMATPKKFDYDFMSANCSAIVFFQFMPNLQPSRSRLPNAWSIKLTFSLIMTFDLAKTENRTKIFLILLSYC